MGSLYLYRTRDNDWLTAAPLPSDILLRLRPAPLRVYRVRTQQVVPIKTSMFRRMGEGGAVYWHEISVAPLASFFFERRM